jgi:uncharacterized repeat protein (TIGR02543 family)
MKNFERFTRLIQKALTILGILGILGFLAGCEMPGIEKPGPLPGNSAGMGRVLVSVGDKTEAARTFMPAHEGLSYTFEFSSTGKSAVSGEINGGSGSIELEAGTWDLRLSAYHAERPAEIVLEGTVTGIAVVSGESTPVSVNMRRKTESGNGTLRFQVVFPGEVSAASLAVYRRADEWQAVSIDLLSDAVDNDGTKTTEGTWSLSAGYYRLALKLSKTGGDISWVDIAHVYPGLTTSAEYTIEEAYFGQVTRLVSFDARGGNPESVSRIVVEGDSVGSAMPDEPDRSGYTFGGWYTAVRGGGIPFTASTAVNANITVYAKWTNDSGLPANLPLADTLNWIADNAVEGDDYTLALTDNETLQSRELSYDGANITISIDGQGKTVTLSSGSRLAVNEGVTLTVKAVTLHRGCVAVNEGGTFIMQDDATVSGNLGSHGVDVSGGIFTMEGNAAVKDNIPPSYSSSSSYGGGVYVSGGIFTMKNSATVSGNTASSTRSSYGGGVYVTEGGVFTMQDNATVTGNEVRASSSSCGGGVYVDGGTFTMKDNATVSWNIASTYGGGVYVRGTFTMQGNATVSDNTAFSGDGGGVYSSGFFTMEGDAVVSGNHAKRGGGVYQATNTGSFTMQGDATVSGNYASTSTADPSYGGGVYVLSGSLTMRDSATVSGNTASSRESSAISSSSNGGGVYSGGNFAMKNSAEVSGNTASSFDSSSSRSSSYGGGVYGGGTFTMKDSAGVSGNTASTYGGGVYVTEGGTFTMEDSVTASGNTAPSGGGVYVSSNGSSGGTFTKKSGTIYGDTDTTHAPDSTENTATNGAGHAVYINGGKQRNADAGPEVNLYARYTSSWLYNDTSAEGVGDTTDNWE